MIDRRLARAEVFSQENMDLVRMKILAVVGS